MEELIKYYKELEKIILSISQNDWEQIVVRIVKDELRNSISIFYKQDEGYVYVTDFIEAGIIDNNEYMFAMLNMTNIASKIKRIFADNKQDLWKTMIFVKNKGEESSISYTYEELDEDLFAEELTWRYKYLNIIPNEANMKYIEGVEQTLL